jgi:hypothetical protein
MGHGATGQACSQEVTVFTTLTDVCLSVCCITLLLVDVSVKLFVPVVSVWRRLSDVS